LQRLLSSRVASKTFLLSDYSRERLMLPGTRAEYIEPDLAPIGLGSSRIPRPQDRSRTVWKWKGLDGRSRDPSRRRHSRDFFIKMERRRLQPSTRLPLGIGVTVVVPVQTRETLLLEQPLGRITHHTRWIAVTVASSALIRFPAGRSGKNKTPASEEGSASDLKVIYKMHPFTGRSISDADRC
jgi:hypothetical protein